MPGRENKVTVLLFFGMEEFYSYKEKTLQKRQTRETKYNNTITKNNKK